jgi:transglutaminase-like putative cysteine protease
VRYAIHAGLQVELSAPVREHHIQLRLAPWADQWQQLDECRLEAEPHAEPICHRDGFGNPLYCLSLMAAHSSLSIDFSADVRTLLHDPFDYRAVTPRRELDWIRDSLRQAPRLWDFLLHRSVLTPDLSDLGLGEESPRLVEGEPLIEQAQAALGWVRRTWERLMRDGDKQAEPSLRSQDYYAGSAGPAHLLVALVRSWGVPARFCTGYLDPGVFASDDEEDDRYLGPESMRAWADVLIPGAGWRGLDPETGLLVNDSYVRVAAGRDADDVPVERAAFKGEGADPCIQFQLKVSPA